MPAGCSGGLQLGRRGVALDIVEREVGIAVGLIEPAAKLARKILE